MESEAGTTSKQAGSEASAFSTSKSGDWGDCHLNMGDRQLRQKTGSGSVCGAAVSAARLQASRQTRRRSLRITGFIPHTQTPSWNECYAMERIRENRS